MAKKTLTGTVISNKMDKTVVVAVESRRQHPLYKKVLRRITKYYAHNEGNMCQEGDVVKIVETHPLSKTKRWRVVEIVSGKGAEVQAAKTGEI